MRSVLCCVLLISWLMLVQAMAQSPFDGVWKAEPRESDTPREPEVYLLQGDTCRCTTCDPPLDIRADGRDQKITGEPCYDAVSLQVVDDRTTMKTDKRGGKTVGSSNMTGSPPQSTGTRVVTSTVTW